MTHAQSRLALEAISDLKNRAQGPKTSSQFLHVLSNTNLEIRDPSQTVSRFGKRLARKQRLWREIDEIEAQWSNVEK